MTRSLYLRVSVTDRCNLRCRYCRPAVGSPEQQNWLTRAELIRLVRAIDRVVPVRKVRFTGGEPLLRGTLSAIVRDLHTQLPGATLAVTTNGLRLASLAGALYAAGLDAINVSLDTPDAERFAELTRGGSLQNVLDGLHAARAAGISRLKLNAVLLRSYNGSHLVDLARLARAHDAELRFIELMPFGVGSALYSEEFLSAEEARSRLCRVFEYLGPTEQSGTADRYRFRDGDREVVVGFITPVSKPFCGRCDRLRIDARGRLWGCLRSFESVDVSEALRNRDPAELERLVLAALAAKMPAPTGWVSQNMAAIGG